VPGLSATERELSASLSYFPLVGLILGGLIAGLNWAASDFWPSLLTAISVVIFLAFLTRGLHLDGLADTADAIGSGASKETALVIMRDSCSGALGVLALVSVLLLKIGAAASLSESDAWQVFILVPCLSRWSLNCLAASCGYARPEGGLGAAFCGSAARGHLIISGLTAISASWFLAGPWGIALFLAATIAGPIAGLWSKARFGGVTGDILGAHLETVETLLFMAGAGMYRWIQ